MITFDMPAAAGDWAADCAEGRAAASRVVELMQSGVAPLALQSAAQQLAARLDFDGVSVGFYSAIAARLS